MKIEKLIKINTILIVTISLFQASTFVPLYLNLYLVLMIIFSFFYEIEKRGILNIIAILSIIYFFKDVSINNLIYSGINSIIFLLGIKFIENKKYRDYMQIYILSLFLIAATSLLNFSIKFLVILLIIILLTTISGIFLTFFDENPKIFFNKKEIFTITTSGLLITIFSIPLMILLFLILPRVDYPLFNFLNKESKGITGFSDRITIGDLSEIQINNSVIFRVRTKKIPYSKLYWSGIYLSFFDGKSWKKPKNVAKIIYVKNNIPANFQQIIFLEPYEYNYLFALDKPSIFFVEKKYKKIINSGRITKKIRYFSISNISDMHKNKEKDINKYLQLPSLSSKIKILAKKLGSIKNIYQYLTSDNFKYTLTNLKISSHPIEDFLFKYKTGNCEFFATAFAILSRLIGVPSRLVAGYVGGEYNKLGKYYIVRESDAHTWVEIYKNNKWIRIDPTIKSLKNYKLKSKSNNLITNLKNFIDLINYYWFIFVINYGFEQQLTLALKMETSLIKFKNIFVNYLTLYSIIFGVFIAIFLFYLFNLKKNKKNLINRFLKKLEKYGYKKSKYQGLLEFIEQIDNNQLKIKSKKFAILYYKIYFGNYKNKQILNELKKIFKKL